MKLPIISFLINLSATIFFSLFTLWLINSWIMYPLFFFEIATITLLFLIINDYDLRIIVKIRIPTSMPLSLILHLVLVVSSATLLITSIIQTQLGIFQVVLSLLCTSLLPGYALLNLFGLRQHFSSLETAVLSYITSYALTAFLTFALIGLSENIRAKLISAFFIVLGLASIMRHSKIQTKNHFVEKSFSKDIDALAITLALTLYVLSLCLIYPSYALIPGTD
ncbi:MAG: hypothetical protein QXZ28_00960, partial [Candidatus Methanomethylicaceae archaeon]